MNSPVEIRILISWHECGECGFQGKFEFRTDAGEDYTDPEALGYTMHTQCPSCEQKETLLVGVEHYTEMVMLAEQSARDESE